MPIVVGIDVGGSTTKIVGLHKNEIISPLLVKANDPVASIYGALGKFLSINKLQLKKNRTNYDYRCGLFPNI